MSQVGANKQTTYTTVTTAGPTTGPSTIPVAAQYATTTSTYQPVAGTTTSNLGTAYYATNNYYTQPATTTYETYSVPQYAVATTGQRAVASEIPVESRIEYIPFEKKYVEYEQVEKIYQVPYETEVI